MKLRLVMIAVLVSTLGLTATAQRGGRGTPPLGGPPPRGGRGGGPDPVVETQRALSLTPAQVDRLRTLLDARAQADQRAEDEVQAKIDAIVALADKPSPNPSEVAAASQSLRDAEQSRRAANDRFQVDFLALLTDEQKLSLDRLTAAAASADALARLGVIGGRGGPGRGPGPDGPPRGGGFGPGGPPPPGPNPPAPESVALGRKLFFDRQLSADGSTSCATCHDPARAFSDGRVVARGVHAAEGARNSPSLINAAFSGSYFWDGRALSLEHQVLGPITNPKELGLSVPELVRRAGMKSGDVAAALASYVRTIRSSGSRVDAYQAGDRNALSILEQAGAEIFRGKGRCATCHAGPNFSDDRFHNTGIAWKGGRIADEGRFVVSQDPRDRGAFKTPTLREIARTGPYMHDGSVATLEDVVDFYERGARRNPYLDLQLRPLGLSSGEKKALVAFLEALTGRVTEGL